MCVFPGGSDGQESTYNVGDLGWEDPLEEGMAMHFNILAWRILMNRGDWWAGIHWLQRVRHVWTTKHTLCITLYEVFSYVKTYYLCFVRILLGQIFVGVQIGVQWSQTRLKNSDSLLRWSFNLRAPDIVESDTIIHCIMQLEKWFMFMCLSSKYE